MRRRRVSVADARAAAWAVRGIASVRRQLRTRRVDDVQIRPPRHPSGPAVRAVRRVLRQRRCTCLEQALLLQAWFTGLHQRRSVIIGVTGPRDFAAHAWLEGDARCHEATFGEIMRLPAP